MAELATSNAAIVGVGQTAFMRGTDRSVLDLILEASSDALHDSGLVANTIDGLIIPGNCVASEMVAANLGISNLRFSTTINMGGASCVAALRVGAAAITQKLASCVLIPFGWHGFSALRPDYNGSKVDKSAFIETMRNFYAPYGLRSPAQLYALYLNRYVESFPSATAGAAQLAVNSRENAQTNPLAYLRGKRLTIEEYYNSFSVASPLRKFDCCLETDCAGAVIMMSSASARDHVQTPILYLGGAEGHPCPGDDIANRDDVLRLGIHSAASEAFSVAGIQRADVDLLELYDCFTYVVLLQLEALGYAELGGAARLVCSGATALDGTLPTNTHGGLLAEGHCWGMNHIIELTRQLRHSAGVRQVNDASIGLVTGYGDFGDGSVGILARDR